MDVRRWSTVTQWNDAALKHQFRLGLSESLKDKLARVRLPNTLETLIILAIQIDRLLCKRRLERYTQLNRVSAHAYSAPAIPALPSPASASAALPSSARYQSACNLG